MLYVFLTILVLHILIHTSTRHPLYWHALSRRHFSSRPPLLCTVLYAVSPIPLLVRVFYATTFVIHALVSNFLERKRNTFSVFPIDVRLYYVYVCSISLLCQLRRHIPRICADSEARVIRMTGIIRCEWCYVKR